MPNSISEIDWTIEGEKAAAGRMHSAPCTFPRPSESSYLLSLFHFHLGFTA